MSNNFFSSFFGGTSSLNSLYSNLSEYNSIRSGNYYRLTKQYFSQLSSANKSAGSAKATSTYDVLEEIRSKYTKSADKTDAASDSKDKTNSTDSTTQTKYEQEKTANNRTAATAASNLTSSLNSLMNKKAYETSDTNTEDKVKENISSAVDKFATSYNSMIDASKKSTASGVATNTKYLMNLTDSYKSKLSDIGVTVGSDGKLSVNKDTLKNADTSAVQNIFANGGGYGSGASTYSSLIGYYANAAGTYTSGGTYYTSGTSAYSTTA